MTADQRARRRCMDYEGRHVVDGRHMPYTGPLGNPTVGYGHLITAGERAGGKFALGLDEQEARSLFREDWRRTACAVDGLLRGRGLAALGDVRRCVLVEMAFQLGVGGCRRFKLMWAALEHRDFAEAAAQMRDSKWRRADSPRRAERLACIMESGIDA